MIAAAPPRVLAPNGAVGFRPSSSTSASSRSRTRTRRISCFAAAPPTATATTTTLYDELGLRVGASVREIKAAYRRLARERHPDVAGAPAADDFLRLHHAYATLSDPDTRARYDRGAAPRAMSQSASTAGGGPRRSGSGRPRRTWETDQCW